MNKAPEGVAAPLEPSQEFEDWKKSLPKCLGYEGGCDGDLEGLQHKKNCPMYGKEFATIKDAFCGGFSAAAAVSKNLQHGRWNAALDKAAEMLSRMQVIAGQPRATVEKAVVEIRKLKEIAALKRKRRT